MNEAPLDPTTCSIHTMWSYYCHTSGIWTLPENMQHTLKCAYYSGFAALLAIMDHLTDLEEHDAVERLRHFDQELQFSARRYRRGPLSGS